MENLTHYLLAFIAVLVTVIALRRERCQERIDLAEREAARRAIDAYKAGMFQGQVEAERHYFDWIDKRK